MDKKVIVMPRASDPATQSLKRLRQIASLLDSIIVIPGTRIEIGLDSIIGLVPGIGDALSALLSSVIIMEGARLGVPFHALLRMILTLLIDTTVGAIPVLGDIFDVAYKANLKNIALIDKYTEESNLIQRSDKSARRAIQLVILLILTTLLLLLILLISWIVAAFR